MSAASGPEPSNLPVSWNSQYLDCTFLENTTMNHWRLSECYNHNIPKCYQLQAFFVEQPPDDLRKSNFFRFSIIFRCTNDEPVDILKANFGHYLNEAHEADLRNGIKYFVKFRFMDGSMQDRSLYLILLDAVKLEPIRYEGQDDNPKMKRVLITHETICTRCIQSKSCGNRNEAPSDPVIGDKGSLRFFLKCNQNCLKGAGNPKDMRRFSLAFSFEDITHSRQEILAISTKMFVHNNSKNSKKRKRGVDSIRESISTKVVHYFPRAGAYGTPIVIYGENFDANTKVLMGNMEIISKVLSDKVIEAHLSYAALPQIFLNLHVPEKHLTIPVGPFINYVSETTVLAAISPKVGICGGEIIFISKETAAVPSVAFTYNGTRLRMRIVNGVAIVLTLPYQMVPGEYALAVFFGSLIQFWIYYKTESPSESALPRPPGQLLICPPQRQSEVPVSNPADEVLEAMIPYNFSSRSPTTSTSSHSPYTTSPSQIATSSPDSMPRN